jgi:Mor family transcriptional regulator
MTATAEATATAQVATSTEPRPVQETSQADMADDYNDLIARMVAYVITVEPALAKRRVQITDDLRKEFGGERWYVPSRHKTDRQERIAAILATFNGRNASEVARKLNVSRATVYRVIKQPGRAVGQGGGLELKTGKK